MDKRRYFAGKLKPGTRKFERCVRKYGPLTEKVVETRGGQELGQMAKEFAKSRK